MKILEVKIEGEVVYSEPILGDIIAGVMFQAKAWAKMKAKGKPYEVNIIKQQNK